MYSIIDRVLMDTNKFYSYLDFQNNLDSTVTNIIDYPGAKDLMENRLNYLNNYTGFNHTIIIDSISEFSNNLSIGDDLWISANVVDANEVILFYRNDNSGIFKNYQYLAAGTQNDGITGDFIYGGKIPNIGNQT